MHTCIPKIISCQQTNTQEHTRPHQTNITQAYIGHTMYVHYYMYFQDSYNLFPFMYTVVIMRTAADACTRWPHIRVRTNTHVYVWNTNTKILLARSIIYFPLFLFTFSIVKHTIENLYAHVWQVYMYNFVGTKSSVVLCIPTLVSYYEIMTICYKYL